MDQIHIGQLYEHYSKNLFDDCLPFWLNNAIDRENGGFLTCLDREGKVYNTDKSIWFQGRGTWLFSRLYNTVDHKAEWLDASKSGYEFLKKYGFDEDGRMFFQVTQDGRPLRKRRYVFSETFAITACAEYYKATKEEEALKTAIRTFELVADLYKNPYKVEAKVFVQTRSMKSLSLPMILLNTIQVLREIDAFPAYDGFALELVETIFMDFFKPEKQALFEMVGAQGERIDSPQGRCVNPGHSIEAASFLMNEGLYRNDRDIINKALKILDWSLELGWDKEYGGLLSFVDIEGKPPEQLEWDMKMWWPHSEALYALLLAHYITDDKKYELWFNKVHDYFFGCFADRVYGEWFGYLHRDGTVANTLKGSMWKGPFHIPRALLLILKLLEKMMCKPS